MLTPDESLKRLAHYYNEQFAYKYLPHFTTTPVDIRVIGYERAGFDIVWGTTKQDTIIRASALISSNPQFPSAGMKELKWEGSLHKWWEALASNAKSLIETSND